MLTAELTAEQADSGAVTLMNRFELAANLNIHLHCLVLDGVYRCDTEGEPVFVEVPAPTDDPQGASIKAPAGTSVCEALLEHGIPIKHACAMSCACTT